VVWVCEIGKGWKELGKLFGACRDGGGETVAGQDFETSLSKLIGTEVLNDRRNAYVTIKG